MATVFPQITENLIAFIKSQPVYFVATAAAQGRVNMSPKGMDSLRVVDPLRVMWLNVSGSGNETAAHIRSHNRMTLMFCGFTGDARILRLYGHARVIHPRDAEWPSLLAQFPKYAGARQIFDLAIDRVQVSCGTGVPVMRFEAERGPDELLPFYANMPGGGVEAYWARKNRVSIDGENTGTVDEDQNS